MDYLEKLVQIGCRAVDVHGKIAREILARYKNVDPPSPPSRGYEHKSNTTFFASLYFLIKGGIFCLEIIECTRARKIMNDIELAAHPNARSP